MTQKPMTPKITAPERWLIALPVAAGLALLLIGIRFLTVPHQAARFFGLGAPAGPFDLHQVIALRDLWLALLLIGLALLREWRALSLCLALGALVCAGDAMIVMQSGGQSSSKPSAIAFHLASGVYCGVLAWLTHRRSQRA